MSASYGHARRGDFVLAEGVDHINHGGYGATPRLVLEAADAWRLRMERDPSTFFRRDLPDLLREAAARVARFFGGRTEDWAFVENATAGLNAVIASQKLREGDEVLCLSQVYGAVGNALRHHAGRVGARVVHVPIEVPFESPEPLLDALEKAIGPRTRLAAFDHVTSAGATLLPLERMIEICRANGVPVAVDGAHALGMFPLDVPSLGADWYVGNLHKWCFAAKGTGAIWCRPERQSGLHPVSLSHYLGQGFVAEFDYSGTRDNSAWLAAPVALDYLEGLGLEALSRRNKALATEAAEMLAEAWRSDIAAAETWRGSIASVRLPGGAGGDRAAARRIARRLIEEHSISAGVMVMEGCLWLRVSAQVYNEPSDYERIAAVGRHVASA